MIPLNKPCIKSASGKYGGYADFMFSNFRGLNSYVLSSAADGLHLIYKSLYEKRGTLKVGVSPLACFQAIYPIVQNGHIPVFVDIDDKTFNMDIDNLMKYPVVDVLEVIHFGGNPNEMDVLCEWARNKHVLLIEDCAQALGAYYKGKMVGNFGDYSVFSLIKNLYSISGGLLLSKGMMTHTYPLLPEQIVLYKRIMRFLEAHCSYKKCNLYNILYYILLSIKERGGGYINEKCFQLSDTVMKEVVACMSQITDYNTVRVTNAEYMVNLIDDSKYVVQQVIEGGTSNRNRLLFKSVNIPAIDIIKYLRKHGIAANNLTQNYLNGYQPNVKEDSVLSGYCNSSDIQCYENTFPFIFSIPNSPFLSKEEMNYITKLLNKL